jgi:hypothetical protein
VNEKFSHPWEKHSCGWLRVNSCGLRFELREYSKLQEDAENYIARSFIIL